MTDTVSFRDAVVAGAFYPGAADALRAEVAGILERLTPQPVLPSAPKAVISPHAGYRFSGLLTGVAIRATRGAQVRRVAVLSPSHKHAFPGVALPSADAYRLPGIEVRIDTAACATLVAAGLAQILDAAHAQEHGIETQLPFLHAIHPGASVIPLVVGDAAQAQVAAVVDALAAMKNPPLFVLSSDLSHFLPLDQAAAKDAETARLIETGGYQSLSSKHACGVRVLRGYLASRSGQGARAARLALANSHGASQDAARTVGYGAWALMAEGKDMVGADHRALLLRIARQALASGLKRGKAPAVDLSTFPTLLRGYGASFVTLKIDGRLRGCIGSLSAHRPLAEDVVINAYKAGFQDPRFRPLRPEDLGRLSIKIAVLSPARPMAFTSEADLEAQLVPGEDGLILSDGPHRGTFLPMIWDSLPTPRAFLEGLKVKAGLPKDHWSNQIKVLRYKTESFETSEHPAAVPA